LQVDRRSHLFDRSKKGKKSGVGKGSSMEGEKVVLGEKKKKYSKKGSYSMGKEGGVEFVRGRKKIKSEGHNRVLSDKKRWASIKELS